jgi:hypothetical protein
MILIKITISNVFQIKNSYSSITIRLNLTTSIVHYISHVFDHFLWRNTFWFKKFASLPYNDSSVFIEATNIRITKVRYTFDILLGYITQFVIYSVLFGCNQFLICFFKVPFESTKKSHFVIV